MLRLFPLVVSLIACAPVAAQDQLVKYFSGATAGVGNLGAQTFDANGDFWVISNSTFSGPAPVPRISKVANSGGTWSAQPHALDEDLRFFYRSSNPNAGFTNPLWGGPTYGTPNSFLLNPAPLTITVPTGTGGVQSVTYQPGELAFITDAMGVLAEGNGQQRADATKKVWRYDLRKVDNPNPFGIAISGPTSQIPDFNNASNGDGTSSNDVYFGSYGLTDWNDAFTMVVSEQDLRNAAGIVDGSDNFGRSFAWSSDGQSIYAIDAGTNTGGIYKIDATKTGVVTRIRADVTGPRIISEPAVVPTSVRDFTPGNPGVGDQIVVMGSGDGGNIGGLNAYLDTGAPGPVGAPSIVFTRAQYATFADYYSETEPQYTSITSDAAGNLYFSESATDSVYRYDPQGRFVKVLSEREQDLFQEAEGFGGQDVILDLQHRLSTGPGFEVSELVYTDDRLDAPVGIYVYNPGDFDRDNDLDADDLAMFAGAIGLRNVAADDANVKFDLNGNEVAFRTTDTMGSPVIRHTNRDQVVVDWKDVKILQQFALFPNGDTNFDMTLNFTDLDVMAANYYTLPNQNAETWITGDFASADPDYLFDAPDANRVDLTDLEVIAEAWVIDLGLTAPTSGELSSRYSGQFLTDAITAFGSVGLPLAGDYNSDGTVNQADYLVWSGQYGQSGAGLAADGTGDGVVNAADYTIWRDALASGSTSVSVPEGATLTMLGLSAVVFAGSGRLRRGLRR